MKQICIIFPHQLFERHPFIDKHLPVILVEEWLFFRQYPFHKKKIILHRASTQAYKHWLQDRGVAVTYIDSTQPENDCRILIRSLAAKGTETIYTAEVADDWLRRRLTKACRQEGIECIFGPSPGFLNNPADTEQFFNQQNRYFQTDFYIWQRKQRSVLIDALGQPAGGKWSFDAENRARFPKAAIAPKPDLPKENVYIKEAAAYTRQHFPDNYGDDDGPCLFAVTFREAEQWLDEFIETRLIRFGDYEDAMVAREPFLFHSVLTPMLNIGLLEPAQVLQKVLEGAKRLSLPVNSVEGFVRQIMGWREFIHLVYEREGRHQRTRNYWGFTRKIPPAFWTGETGIDPVDRIIKKVLRYGYCHHIERLMVLGNFMLLCEFDPDEVYRWFMELFIDAYDWVMVPNVYGMTQFADGGLMTTKPYISGSNYLLKMGDFPRGDWQPVWDGLFWRFMMVHRDFFSGNPRLGMLLGALDKMPAEKRDAHMRIAQDYLENLRPPPNLPHSA